MKLVYNGLVISDLGEFTMSQGRDYEDGQRVKVTLRVGVTLFERSYGDNYALVKQLREALRTQQGVLQWTNTDTNEDYVNQTVTVQSGDLPEEWGEYQMQFNLVFFYYEQALVTNNLSLTFTPGAGGRDSGAAVVLGNVTRFSESALSERFSPFHSQRSMMKGEVSVSGMLLVDTTLSLADRRTALARAKQELMAALNSSEGLLQFGDPLRGAALVFSHQVRPEKPSVEIDQLHWAVLWSFTGSYILFPGEREFAVVDMQAAQREAFEPATGEQVLSVTGKIDALNEAVARAKLAAVVTAVLGQYGYQSAQALRSESTARQISSMEDGDSFIELSFTLEWRRFRADRMRASFTPDGATDPVVLGQVRLVDWKYSARRFSELHSQRQYAGGQISLSGTLLGSRDQLLAQAAALQDAVNEKEGRLVYGGLDQVVRVTSFSALVNQAETGIEWTMEAIYSRFPNESGYAVVEFTASQESNVEDGEERLIFSGNILAPDESLARVKLASLRTMVLATYGYNLAQQLRPHSNARKVDADTDGAAFIELTFNEEYRRRRANLTGWAMQTNSRSDPGIGLLTTVYAGHVIASGATVDAAYAAAMAKVVSLVNDADVVAQLGTNAFRRRGEINWEQRQTEADNVIEFVRLTFSIEYQSKLGAGQSYLEVNTDKTVETFGTDMVTVSGFVVAMDFATAQAIYQAQVRAEYAGSIIHGERLAESKVMMETLSSGPPSSGPPSSGPPGGYATQQLRLEFNFTVFAPKAAGSVTYRYTFTVSNDYLTLTRATRVRGSAFATDEVTAASAAAALLGGLAPAGSGLVRDERSVDHEYTSDADEDAVLKYDFEAEWSGRITGVSGLLEMRLSVAVKYSGVRWIVQPIPRDATGAGGVSIVQDGGVQEGGRMVRGSVTAASQVTAEGWARQQRALLTGDADGGSYPLPEELETEYEFVPRVDGVAQGSGQNVKLYRVNFGFGEILPNYPATR
jgi:hypothetical protein